MIKGTTGYCSFLRGEDTWLRCSFARPYKIINGYLYQVLGFNELFINFQPAGRMMLAAAYKFVKEHIRQDKPFAMLTGNYWMTSPKKVWLELNVYSQYAKYEPLEYYKGMVDKNGVKYSVKIDYSLEAVKQKLKTIRDKNLLKKISARDFNFKVFTLDTVDLNDPIDSDPIIEIWRDFDSTTFNRISFRTTTDGANNAYKCYIPARALTVWQRDDVRNFFNTVETSDTADNDNGNNNNNNDNSGDDNDAADDATPKNKNAALWLLGGIAALAFLNNDDDDE